MEKQPTVIVIPYPISDFLNWEENEQLIISPKFQRRRVWVPKARSYFIDTILRKMPIPPVIIRYTIDPVRARTIREIVDGQQRIGTIFDFIRGRVAILPTHNPEFAGLTYSELPEEVQAEFLSYKISVNVLEGVSDEDVLKIFTRMNTYMMPLNRQELRNAQFFGAFKQTVYEVAVRHLAFWSDNNILTSHEIARMADTELVSEMFLTMIEGFRDTKDASLRRVYKMYDDEFPQAAKLTDQFERTIDMIGEIFDKRLPETPFHRAPLFFSLFMFIYDALFGLPGESTPKLAFGKQKRQAVLGSFLRLGEIIRSSEPPEQYLALVEAARRGTSDPVKRRTRHNYLWQFASELPRQK